MSQYHYVDEEAEQRVIGALLLGTPNAARLVRDLGLDHFSFIQTKWLFDQICKIFLETGDVPTAKVLRHRLWDCGARQHKVEQYEAFMERLMDEAEALRENDVDYYVESLKDKADGRRILDLVGTDGEGVLKLLDSNNVKGAKKRILDWVYKQNPMTEIRSGSWYRDRTDRQRIVERMRNEPEAFRGIETGIAFLDGMTSGLLDEEIGMWLAESGAGKSSALCHLAYEAWSQGKWVLFITIEMPRVQVEFKLDSRLTSIDSAKLRKAFIPGMMTDSDVDEWVEKLDQAKCNASSDIVIVDCPDSCTIADIETVMMEKQRELGVKFDMVMIDHMGLISPRGDYERGRFGWDAQGEISQDIKLLARRQKVRIWVAVQEKATATKQEKKKGAFGLFYGIKQAADLVIVMEKNEEEDDIVGIRIAKHRYGVSSMKRCKIDYAHCFIEEDLTGIGVDKEDEHSHSAGD